MSICVFFLKKEASRNIYKHDESKWSSFLHDNLLLPIIVKVANRSHIKRRREVNEGRSFHRSSSLKCSNYDEWG